ncbi:unnamed protein product [Brassicogethes aeneus]|uniref:Uncharacterized protein n=1 Tax=Brassicogethes aeneus TaxID=1431903 RepID=A0A9P0FNT6_BRAAE|nr:unnamed protein product [Brassicogethes aeneus]
MSRKILKITLKKMGDCMRPFKPNIVSEVFKERLGNRFLNSLKTISNNIREYENDIQRSVQILNIMIEKRIGSSAKLSTLKSNLIDINNTTMYLTTKNLNINTKVEIIKFCQDAIDNNESSLKTRYSLFVNFITNESDFFKSLLDKNGEKTMKMFGQSAEILFKILFDAFFIVQLKAEITMQFSYNFLRLTSRGSYYDNILFSNNEYILNRTKLLDIYYEIMKYYGEGEIWNAIDKYDKQDETYSEVTKLLQGFLQNEEHLNAEKSCWKSCDKYRVTRETGFGPAKCENRGCKGRVLSCQWVGKDVTICPSSVHTSRRYDYLSLDDKKRLGAKIVCPNSQCSVTTHGGFLGIARCDYCLCICEETDALSDRYISLRPVTTNVFNNMVVTGLRIAKKNRIFHLEIQEGKLSKFGEIIGDKKWVKTEHFHITSKNVYNNLDYHTLTYDKRSMEMTNTKLPSGFVVTGVRFQFDKDLIKLRVQGTTYDYFSGRINNKPHWFSNPNEYPRKIPLNNTDIPCRDRLKTPERELRKRAFGDTYVEFTHTDIDKDVAQTTVPFFEVVGVTAEKGPLQGAGIYYKGSEGYGGFVAPLLTGFDFSASVKSISNSILEIV